MIVGGALPLPLSLVRQPNRQKFVHPFFEIGVYPEVRIYLMVYLHIWVIFRRGDSQRGIGAAGQLVKECGRIPDTQSGVKIKEEVCQGTSHTKKSSNLRFCQSVTIVVGEHQRLRRGLGIFLTDEFPTDLHDDFQVSGKTNELRVDLVALLDFITVHPEHFPEMIGVSDFGSEWRKYVVECFGHITVL